MDHLPSIPYKLQVCQQAVSLDCVADSTNRMPGVKKCYVDRTNKTCREIEIIITL
jgi:hypothetical protein